MTWDLTYLAVIALGAMLALIGFSMAFCQAAVRQLLGRPAASRLAEDDEDPLAYALRISGVMVMAFSIIISAMFTAFHLAS
jgi:hypothetical protein